MDSTGGFSRGAREVVAAALDHARRSQRGWAERPIRDRLRIIGRTRRLLARECEDLAALLVDRRCVAETLVAEVLPLAEAARFLERRAESLLAPQTLRGGRPLWLLGVKAEIRREPLGVVLVIGPSNYPLFLPGAQILQALAAGNAVCVKPAPGCSGPMLRLAELLSRSGLPEGVLTVLDETTDTSVAAVAAGFDRIVLTGSADTGRAVLRSAAERLTPATMELSGNDPMFVLPGADLGLVASCLAYGLRLNGGATCLAPRRVFVPDSLAAGLEQEVLKRIKDIPPVAVPDRVLQRLQAALEEAAAAGACVHAWPEGGHVPPGHDEKITIAAAADFSSFRPRSHGVPPIIVTNAQPGLRLLREDIFAPVVAIVPVSNIPTALEAASLCPYALGASIFGPTPAAQDLAARVRAGSVVINDIIVPTADPRLPFGGRGESGFGVTRGGEGLLEMTAVKTISLRRGRFRPHLGGGPTGKDRARFARMIRLLHGGVWFGGRD